MEGLIILGTRPEAIKLIPVLKLFKKSNISIKVLSTEQHSDAVNQLFIEHKLLIDYKLRSGFKKNLSNQLAAYLSEFDGLLNHLKFDFIITQGDTLSAYAGMIYAYLNKIDYIYIESGLRTNDLYNPYPEEGLRVMMSHVSKMNFVPTEKEKAHLLKENIYSEKILVVGNTGIDYIFSFINENQLEVQKNKILLTVHRRENLEFLDVFFIRLGEYAKKHSNIEIIYPMHFNPFIQNLANKYLSCIDNIKISYALSSQDFYAHLQTAEVVVTDSGGVQEEATFLNKKLIIIRNKTERYHQNQFNKIIAIDDTQLFLMIDEMLNSTYETSNLNLFYGDGKASSRILDWIKKEYLE
jgi:UDP-N-acetylglucosamine 2-epimerase (non-hydrolysing)